MQNHQRLCCLLVRHNISNNEIYACILSETRETIPLSLNNISEPLSDMKVIEGSKSKAGTP